MKRRFGAFGSSTNPEALGETVKGAIIAASVAIIWGANLLGFDIINQQVTDFAVAAGTAVSSLWILFGLLQKVFVAVYDKFNPQG